MSSEPHPDPAHSGRNPGYAPQFVAQVLDDALAHGARIYAIAGLQGTGKSTLSAQVVALGRDRGLNVVALSIDDFYLGQTERQALGRHVHPLCATRGPPGTHDVRLACDVLDALRAHRPTALPRFDKIADDRLPRGAWPTARDTDLTIFEGWFQKVPPEAPDALVAPLNALEREEDPDGTWRGWVNRSLGDDYPPLWERIDRVLFLQGPGFGIVPAWRWQQEQTLQAAHPGRQAMTQPQVERFVQFFERVSRQAMRTLPDIAERTVRLDAQRRPLDA
jgi:D-glycerate 3-kinase